MASCVCVCGGGVHAQSQVRPCPLSLPVSTEMQLSASDLWSSANFVQTLSTSKDSVIYLK